MKIALGAVAAGFSLKEALKKNLKGKGDLEIIDLGVHSADKFVRYPDIARKMVAAMQRGEVDRGILVCGTGMGMALTANKYRGILAACCESIYSARFSRIYNNSNVLTLGEFMIGTGLAIQIVEAWLKADFKGIPASDELKKAWQEMVEDMNLRGEKAT
jgi:ribose 5-phosphate isomerase B